MAHKYLRVWTDNGQRLDLLVTCLGTVWLRGYRVNSEGDEVLTREGYLQQHWVHRHAVLKYAPLAISRKYGTLRRTGKRYYDFGHGEVSGGGA